MKSRALPVLRTKSKLGRLLAATLLAAAVPLPVAACGVCIEDKVAATYDFEVAAAATKKQHAVLFFELQGAVANDPKTVQAIAAAAAKVRGVERDSTRVSLQPAAVSVVVNPKRHATADMQARLQQALAPWRLQPKLLRTIEDGRLTAPAR